MPNSLFFTPPSWISSLPHLKNVLDNQLSSPHDAASFSTLTDNTLLCSGLKQAVYWRKQLLPSISSNTAIFSLLGPQGLVLPNITEVLDALKGVCNLLNITEFYKSPNSTFIGVSFSNPSDVLKIQTDFSFYQDFIVYHVKSVSTHTHDFKLLWLPPLFSAEKIHSLFRTFSAKHSFTRQLLKINSDMSVPTNVICGSFEPLPHVSIHNLPHLIPLPSPHLGQALFIISGRSPLCLKCNQQGHIRRTCPSSRCLSCNRFHLSSSGCLPKSFSSAVSGITHWPDNINVIDSPSNLLPSSTPTPLIELSPPQSSQDHVLQHHFDVNTMEHKDAYINTSLSILQSSPLNCASTLSTSTSDPALSTSTFSTITPMPNDLPSILTHNLSTSLQKVIPSSHLELPVLTTPTPHTVTLNTKRITRSMTSHPQSTHILKDNANVSCFNAVSKPGFYDALHDEVDSSDADSPDSSTADPLDVAMDPHSSLSDCSISVRSRSPLHANDFDHAPGENSKTSSPLRSHKKTKVTSFNHSSPLGSQHNLAAISSIQNWTDQVEETDPTHALHNIDSPSPELFPPVLESSSPSASSVTFFVPHCTISYCNIICLQCNFSICERWPLRKAHTCQGCDSKFITPFEKRFYPLPDKAKIALSLSSTDHNDPSSIFYLNCILSAGVSVVPI